MRNNLDKYIEKRKKKKFQLMQEIFIILFLILSGCFQNNLFSQTEIDYSQMLHFKNSIKIDSIFEHFQYPTLPKEVKFPNNIEWQNLYVAVFVDVDTNNKVKNIRIYRLYEFTGDTIMKLKIWDMISNSIKKASETWTFKEVKWKIPEFDQPDNGLSDYIRKSNNSKQRMPFAGQPQHLIIIHYTNDIGGDDIPFIYQIKVE